MSENMFPIQSRDFPGSPSEIPWRLLDEGWAQHNHGQSLKRLAERGGLSPGEALANIERRGFWEKKYERPGQVLADLIKRHNLDALAERIACSFYGYFKGDSAGSADAMQYFQNYKASGECAHLIERARNELRVLET